MNPGRRKVAGVPCFSGLCFTAAHLKKPGLTPENPDFPAFLVSGVSVVSGVAATGEGSNRLTPARPPDTPIITMRADVEALLVLQDREQKIKALQSQQKSYPLDKKSLEGKLAASRQLLDHAKASAKT